MLGGLLGRSVGAAVAATAAAALLAGCAAPAYTYASSRGDGTFLRVPSSWTQFREDDLEKLIYGDDENAQAYSDATWNAGFDASATPEIDHVISLDATDPAVWVSVRPVSADAQSTLGLDELRDSMLPVTDTARASAAAQGQLLAGFELVTDVPIDDPKGLHGVHTVFRYTVDGTPQTYEQKVLLNADNSKLYSLLVHCSTTCFTAYEDELDDVVTSFTVRQ